MDSTKKGISGGQNNPEGWQTTIDDWRNTIDQLDEQIVQLINDRARAASAIGDLKHQSSLPVYEPKREQHVFEHVRAVNQGPLPDTEIQHIYERIIDVMRALQKKA